MAYCNSLYMIFFCRSSSFVMFVCMIFSLLFLHGTSIEFEVGDGKGWEVPPSKDPHLYNEWAQKNRFVVNDTLHFSYKKDSVMVVTDTEYNKCESPRPLFFDKDGDTTFLLDRPGLFYFMSGVSGHCERGQKMIVKVLDVESPPAHGGPSQDANPSNDNNKNKSGASWLMLMGFTSFPSLVLLLMIVGFIMITN
ncbi:hypothetical protein Cgig2_015490 [Carnegiea gigantea]|uniref:Phytocyanin domain-containing protein n=1 Tax=Carnegiea gigantea TaxID=171969 RepID=A0A9Q1KFY4_9CARY|nr:hypothetical protein Cgig2_015490 [Carnegiea gigantea]